MASAIASVSSRVSASGFSTNTALPVSSAWHTSFACVACLVTMKIASRLSSLNTASESVLAVVKPNFCCAFSADSDLVVATCARLAAPSLRQVRQQHGRGVVSCPDKADPHLGPVFPASSERTVTSRPEDLACRGLGRAVGGLLVLQQDPDSLEGAVLEVAVHLRGVARTGRPRRSGSPPRRNCGPTVPGRTPGCASRSTGCTRPGSRCPRARTGCRTGRARRTSRTGRRVPSHSRRSTAGPASSCRCRRLARGRGRALPPPRPGRWCGRRRPGRCGRRRVRW